MTADTTRYVPAYIVPGATVAAYWRRRGNPVCVTGIVEKVNKASVTVRIRGGEAERYSLAHSPTASYGGAPTHDTGGTWGTTAYLLPMDNPDVITCRARQRAENMATAVVTAANDLLQDPENLDLIAAVQAAAAALSRQGPTGTTTERMS